MATTPNQGLPYQTLADPPHGPNLGQQLAVAVEPKLVMRFASAADRAAKVPAPTIGMLSWVDDLQRLEFYTTVPAAGWVPLTKTPFARIIDTAGAAQTNGTATLVPWDTNVHVDPATMHSTAVNPSRLIAPIAGVYLINSYLRWITNSTGVRTMNIRRNAAGNNAGGESLQTSTVGALSTNQTSVNVSLSRIFAAGDYIEVFGTQNGGAGVTLNGLGSFLELIFLRAAF
jgi:hypothetical protein